MELQACDSRRGDVLTELASGIDALYLLYRADVPSDVMSDLARGKAAAQEAESALPFEFGPVMFEVQPKSFGRYRYCLTHRYAQIGVTPRKGTMPEVRVQPRAEYLHAAGALAAAEQLTGIVASVCGEVVATVSRVDLFSDWQGWDLHGDRRGQFVCRGAKRTLHERGETFGGLGFGSRASHTFTARIYDKTREIQQKGADYWFDIWGPRFVRDQPVHRIEFEIGRSALNEFGVIGPNEVVAAAGRMWGCASESWLSYRVPTLDSTRSRWPLDPVWKQIQHPTMREEALGLDRVRAGQTRGSVRTLLPQLVGYLASLAAVLDLHTFDGVAAVLPALVADYCLSKQSTFEERVDKKRHAYSGS
jgi:hypothetical protein